jgi:hypothetical protein
MTEKYSRISKIPGGRASKITPTEIFRKRLKKVQNSKFFEKKFLRFFSLKHQKMNLKQKFYQVSASASEIGSTQSKFHFYFRLEH